MKAAITEEAAPSAVSLAVAASSAGSVMNALLRKSVRTSGRVGLVASGTSTAMSLRPHGEGIWDHGGGDAACGRRSRS